MDPDIADVLAGRRRWCVVTGDCLNILPTLPDGCVHTVSDPPYGIADCWKGGFGRGWGKASDAAEERNSWDAETPSKAAFDEIIRVSELVCLWGGNYFSLPTSRGWLVWNKPERGFTLSEAELAWTNVDMPMRVFDGNRSDRDRWHPTQKTVALMLWSIRAIRVPADSVVLDPFAGSCTTGVAALGCGMRFIGIEKNEGYAERSRRRIAEADTHLFAGH